MWRAAAAVSVAGLTMIGLASAADGGLATVAGTGTGGFSGDGGPATSAMVQAPGDAVALPGGGYLIADTKNNRIRRVAPDGTIETVAGTGVNGYNGDGIAAKSAHLNEPGGVALTDDGGYLIADSFNHRVRKVGADGLISTVAGSAVSGFAGDGGPATSAQLKLPSDVAPTADGGYLIADHDNNRVRKVDAEGRIATLAGIDSAGFSGDGGPATSAKLNGPRGVAEAADGAILFADRSNNRIRRISPGGTISTVVGDGSSGFAGDGGPATSARVSAPHGVLGTADGGYLVADSNNNRIRRVTADGTIGTLDLSLAEDGTPALNAPAAVTLAGGGELVVSDTLGHRVRVGATTLAPVGADAGTSGGDSTSSAGGGGAVSGNDGLPDAAPPIAGKRLNVEPVRGTVRVQLPRSRRWVAVEEAGRIPVGTLVDTRHGTARLVTVPGAAGDPQAAVFWGGTFRVRQGTRSAPVTNLLLNGRLAACPRGARAAGRRV
ncbi:MAG: hypothetical protein M3N16_06540, partial [Actinomycetota bacterium]|nr:hypothetical protein [Actinomycetota bacterium]